MPIYRASFISPTPQLSDTVTPMEDRAEKFAQIAKELHERIACGCHPDPCWTCQQVSKRYLAITREDTRISAAQDKPQR